MKPGKPSNRICRMASQASRGWMIHWRQAMLASLRAQGDLRYSACSEDGLPLARRASPIRAADHDQGPLSPLVAAPHLAAHLRADGGCGCGARRAFPRQHSRQGAPLGPEHKRGAWRQAIGTSRGGRTSKIHALAEAVGRPVAFALTPGNVADITMAIPIMEGMPRPRRLLADRAHDADKFRTWLRRRRIEPVIPSTATRNRPWPLDRSAYRRRNVIERMFGKLKNWRRIATRYDRLARNYLAALAIVSVVIAWC